MSKIIEQIEQALTEQDIEKVYELYNGFFEDFDSKKDLEELIELAEFSLSIGFLEESRRAFLLLTELEPSESAWTIQLAQIMIENGEYDQALSVLYDIPSTDVNYPAVLVCQADLYQEQGYLDVAERKLMEAKNIAPDEVSLDYYLGALLFEAESFSRSQSFLESYLKKQEDELFVQQAKRMLVVIAIMEDDFEVVEAHLEDMEMSELPTPLLLELATLYTYHHHFQKATELYAEVLLRDDEPWDAYYGLAQILQAEGKIEESIEQLEAILSANPFYVKAYELQYNNYLAQSDYKAALALATKEVEYVPESTDAVIRLATIQEELDLDDDAVMTINKAEYEQLFDPKLVYLKARCYDKLEEFALAAEAYKEASNYYGDSIDFIMDYAKFLREDGKREEALKVIDKGLTIDPLNMMLVELKSTFD
ncbi:Tetratricopeptide repeat-containing protein [Granulicatella balaenopterae]|uniref:Tetratricopeptide repeat-containing protein n=1 Tax=Granulicatella balaenopterae TaxID=137733 RepID=A0A1H9JYV0_9LACT|nr:tetratricopeptide repeat protein [Granulicatella balaenopterae]SEQ92136.1 Tetratricopeptide repeat-containing protein [Granulicatella balaenopterae]